MDNLTHSLIGAALGYAGLKRKTGLAMPALIIAANLPDVDVACFLWLEGLEHLAFRRGITHGPIALVVLPLLLWGALLWFDRWQAQRGKRPESRLPIHRSWLLALCYIGCFTHPFFDWLNNYGIRLLEPFSSQWFYGDALFIIDPWIIAMLGAGVWFSRKLERITNGNWTRPARIALSGMAAFVLFNFGLSHWAASRVEMDDPYPQTVVASAVPISFLSRDVVWRTQMGHGTVGFSLFGPRQRAGESDGFPTNMTDPRVALWSKHNPAARAFLFWSRMPIAELHEDHIVLRDQRYLDPRASGQFSVTLRPPTR